MLSGPLLEVGRGDNSTHLRGEGSGFSGWKLSPTLSSEKRAPGGTGSVILPCRPRAASCEAIECRTAMYPNKPGLRRCAAPVGERRRLESSYFLFLWRIFINSCAPRVLAVLLEPGAFDFSTRIKGGGRKAPQCGVCQGIAGFRRSAVPLAFPFFCGMLCR